MKYLDTFKLFERKGNYQLFHKTHKLTSILNDGYIYAGGNENDIEYWNYELRKSVFPNWEKDNPKFKTISATRNLHYFGLPALELDVEKISDKYKIVPFSENPDFYLDFKGKPAKTALTKYQNMIRSKDKNAGKLFWRTKTDKNAFDYDIDEELILTDKLDVSKYVKRIILEKSYYGNENDKIKKLVNNKYPHIEVIELNRKEMSKYGYLNIKNALKKKKERENIKSFNEMS